MTPMLEFLEKLLQTSRAPEDNDDHFVKEHETEFIQTWCRVKLSTESSAPTIQGVDGRVLQGAVEKLSDLRGSSKKLTTWIETAWVSEDGVFKANELFHEAAIGYLVRKYLSDVPVYSRALLLDASVDKRKEKGYLVFDKCQGEPLETIINDLNVDELRSIIAQVLAAICIGQDRLLLKHHDLHLLNILVSEVESNSTWRAELPFGTVEIPLIGFQATVIDFGLSSATNPETGKRHTRLDEELIVKKKHNGASSCSDDDWGVWGPELETDTGYDFAMFVESLAEELCRDRPLSIPKLQVISALQELVDIDFTERGRPAERCCVDWKQVFSTLGIESTKAPDDVSEMKDV